jgi:hypothetical protein
MALTKTNTIPLVNIYGGGPFYILFATLVGAGSGKAPTISSLSSTVSPPCQAELLGANITYVSTGVNTLLFQDANYAVAFAIVAIDDLGTAPYEGNLGQWTNLGSTTSPPVATGCTLTTYNPLSSYGAADIPLGTLIRLMIVFKKSSTGATA